ncbi:L,D-transpeptidase family protein [Myxococcaceae bacterium JPH2]|nr:L,D-transpeptidase family protein [Myxococcaceae bacterium JPH2]
MLTSLSRITAPSPTGFTDAPASTEPAPGAIPSRSDSSSRDARPDKKTSEATPSRAAEVSAPRGRTPRLSVIAPHEAPRIPQQPPLSTAPLDASRSSTQARSLLELLDAPRAAGLPSPIAAPLAHARFTGLPQLADVAAGGRVLGPGSRGEGLRAVQAALLDMGFALLSGADGIHGPDTTRALRNFQVHARSKFPDVRSTGVLDTATLRALDALAPARGTRGQSRHVPIPLYEGQPVRIVVALREHRTFLFDPEGRLLDIFPNAAGTVATPTHRGLKVVRAKLDQVAAEAAGARLWNDRHVFGVRILDLSWANGGHSGEELHGTSAPALLGGDVSHGCVRHDNEHIVAMYDALSVGDRVAVVETVDDPNLGVPVSVS